MGYINIISKEQITTTTPWQALIVLMICILMLACSVYGFKRVPLRYFKIYSIFVLIIITSFEIISLVVCDKYFSVPTGKYKYEATINKDKITIQQYEEFIEKYNPTIKNGIYYWESEEIIYEENRAI